ncbi:uncharacterized protein LOC106666831 [Cimex lectularius]|uniref:Uncharacterized protein n=1 Tax=Cimex lectularius TaxID=79782 RepID=A0A8I6RRJ4_CIMLE|nr:uncharacterized protein LOC106666831 [Cimex lectularius]
MFDLEEKPLPVSLKDDKMEMKLFVRDWLYHHSPAFRENDEEFIAKLEEYRKELFRKTVELSKQRPQKDIPKSNIKDRFSKTLTLPETVLTIQIPKVEQKRWKHENEKYIPVIVTDLLHAPQKKVKFNKENKDSVNIVPTRESINIDTSDTTSQLTTLSEIEGEDKVKIDEVKEEENQKDSAENEPAPIKKKRKKEFVWLVNARKLRALLKILVVHKNDGLSELLKFLKRNHITNNYAVTKLKTPEQSTAEKFIVEQLQNVKLDLNNLLDCSKCLSYSRKVYRQKIRRRILEITDSIKSVVRSCLIRASRGVTLDPINLYNRLQRIESMYTTLYRDDIHTILKNTPSVDKKKKVSLKTHKVVKVEKEQLTGTVYVPPAEPVRDIKECKSDLICIVKKKSKPNLIKSSSMPTIEKIHFPSLLAASSKQLQETAEVDQHALENFMIEIECMVMQKLNEVLDTDAIIEQKSSEKQPSKKFVRIEELNKELSIGEKSAIKESSEVASLIETWDSIVIAKEKLQGPDFEEWTKPNFNERLPKAEDSLLVLSKKLNVSLKFHTVTPRVRTPYDSRTDLNLNVSRTCAHLDLLNMDTSADEIIKPSLMIKSQAANEIKPLDIIKRPSKMVLDRRKAPQGKKPFHPTWVP